MTILRLFQGQSPPPLDFFLVLHAFIASLSTFMPLSHPSNPMYCHLQLWGHLGDYHPMLEELFPLLTIASLGTFVK